MPQPITVNNTTDTGLLFCGALCAAWFAACMWTFGSGWMHLETPFRLAVYTSDKLGFLEKIFNPLFSDSGYYRVRDFSYLADWADFNFSLFISRHFFLYFHSALSYALIIGAALLNYRLCAVYYRLQKPSLPLLAATALFLLAPSIFFQVGLFRSAKVLSSFLLLLAFWLPLLLSASHREDFPRWLKNALAYPAALAFLLGFLMSISDEQGVCFLALLPLAGLFLALRGGWTAYLGMIKGFAAALAAYFVYAFFICPWIVELVSHYRPQSSMSGGNFLATVSSPEFLFSGFSLASVILTRFAGNLPSVFGVLLFLCLLFAAFRKGENPGQKPYLLFLSCMLPPAVIVLFAGMAKFHPIVLDYTIVYYWLPATMLLFFMLSQLSCLVVRHTRAVAAVLVLLCFGSAAALPTCRRVLLEGEYGTYLEATEAVKLEIEKDRGLLDDTAQLSKRYKELLKDIMRRKLGREPVEMI